MRILSITAQKPSSTGSGVYLTELVKEFARKGHSQAVVAGVYREDQISLPAEVGFYPVYFQTETLPYPIAGMSDEMPYPSTRYCDMTEEMTEAFGKAFLEKVEEIGPDLIVLAGFLVVIPPEMIRRARWSAIWICSGRLVTASNMSLAEMTGITFTAMGAVNLVGPVTRVTSAPLNIQALAIL